jgi:hypothetical protein
MNLVWTKTPPAEQGWYWATIGDYHKVLSKGVVILVRVTGEAPFLTVVKTVTVFGMEVEVEPNGISQWAGPIPTPEDPAEEGGK